MAKIDSSLTTKLTQVQMEIGEVKSNIGKEIDTKLCSVSDEVQLVNKAVDNVKQLAAEEIDKENRRCNIVMYRATESPADNATERGVQDKRFVCQMLTGLQVGVAEEDIRQVIRPGRYGEGANARRLLVQLGSRLAKNLVMESLYKLKSMDEKFRRVIVTDDLTKKEREECKQLVEEAKAKTSADVSGEWIYQVRGPPGKMVIVKMRRRNN